MKTAAFTTLARTLLSLIPSGAIVAEFADESRAGNLPWTRQVLFGKSSCTATESTVAVFLCDESGLQVRTRNRICCGENPECDGSKTVSETV